MPLNKMATTDISPTGHWNGLSTFERLKLILEHRDLFVSLALVSNAEVELATQIPMRDWEYMITREKQPVFSTLSLKDTCETQTCREKLKTALRAVFL